MPLYKIDHPKFEAMMDDYYYRFCLNFVYYIGLSSKTAYGIRCTELNTRTRYKNIYERAKGIKREIYDYQIAQAAYISNLSMQTWMIADMTYLHKNGIIILDGLEFVINPNYITDGVFFYSKQFDRAVPLGSPHIQKYVDELGDIGTWKYQQPHKK